jgi:hypothetical protein
MPEKSGWEFIKGMKAQHRDTLILVMPSASCG